MPDERKAVQPAFDEMLRSEPANGTIIDTNARNRQVRDECVDVDDGSSDSHNEIAPRAASCADDGDVRLLERLPGGTPNFRGK